MEAFPHLSAVLLAAGESTRMGRPKPLLPWQGRTLLEYQVDSLLGAGAGEVVVVVGHRAREVIPLLRDRPRVRYVLNPQYRKGKTTSIKAGLGALSPEAQAVMFLAVDQPRPPSLLGPLIRAHFERGALITLPLYQGKRGHPPIFSSSLMSELLEITEEKQGLREVLERHVQAINEVAVDSPLARLDLNTPQAYEEALRLFAS